MRIDGRIATMSTEPTPTPEDPAEAEKLRVTKEKHDHDDALVDEWEEESFPASDPPANF